MKNVFPGARFRLLKAAGSLCFCAGSLCAQKTATVTATPGIMIPVHTAVGHLTVLDLDAPIEEVAAESNAFHVEWRGRTLFVYAGQPGVATNVFVWTKRGRVIYELLPATADIAQMDVSIETRLPAPPVPAPAAAPRPAEAEQIPPDLMVRARTVEWSGHKPPKNRTALLVRDVYRGKDRLYLRYEVRNHGSGYLHCDAPLRVTATPVTNLPSSVPRGRAVQLVPDSPWAFRGQGGEALPVLAQESDSRSIAPGQTGLAITGVQLPEISARPPLLVQVLLSPRNALPLSATLVVP